MVYAIEIKRWADRFTYPSAALLVSRLSGPTCHRSTGPDKHRTWKKLASLRKKRKDDSKILVPDLFVCGCGKPRSRELTELPLVRQCSVSETPVNSVAFENELRSQNKAQSSTSSSPNIALSAPS